MISITRTKCFFIILVLITVSFINTVYSDEKIDSEIDYILEQIKKYPENIELYKKAGFLYAKKNDLENSMKFYNYRKQVMEGIIPDEFKIDEEIEKAAVFSSDKELYIPRLLEKPKLKSKFIEKLNIELNKFNYKFTIKQIIRILSTNRIKNMKTFNELKKRHFRRLYKKTSISKEKVAGIIDHGIISFMGVATGAVFCEDRLLIYYFGRIKSLQKRTKLNVIEIFYADYCKELLFKNKLKYRMNNLNLHLDEISDKISDEFPAAEFYSITNILKNICVIYNPLIKKIEDQIFSEIAEKKERERLKKIKEDQQKSAEKIKRLKTAVLLKDGRKIWEIKSGINKQYSDLDFVYRNESAIPPYKVKWMGNFVKSYKGWDDKPRSLFKQGNKFFIVKHPGYKDTEVKYNYKIYGKIIGFEPVIYDNLYLKEDIMAPVIEYIPGPTDEELENLSESLIEKNK